MSLSSPLSSSLSLLTAVNRKTNTTHYLFTYLYINVFYITQYTYITLRHRTNPENNYHVGYFFFLMYTLF